MAPHHTLRAATRTLRAAARTGRGRAAAALAAAAIGAPLLLAPAAAHAAAGPIWGTLDTQTSTAATEAANGVAMAMFEFNWAAYEPAQGKYAASYMTAMKAQLAAYQAAGMKVTLGLGLQDPPAWALALANGTYIDQTGTPAAGAADLVFSTAVRNAAAAYLAKINTTMPLDQFWAIRLGDAAGDGEMLYPGTGTYYAFENSALTGTGLPAGVGKNPDPAWKPGTPGLTPAQITNWITWYVGGLDNLTSWEMTTLGGLGFGGYYQTLTPGSGTRPDQLVDRRERQPPQRRHHRRRRRLAAVLRQPPLQDRRHRLHLLRRRPVRRQRPVHPGRRHPAPDQPGARRVVRHPVDHPDRQPVRPARRRGEPRPQPARQPRHLLHQHHQHRDDGRRRRPGPLLRVHRLLLGPRRPPVGRHHPLHHLRRHDRRLTQSPGPRGGRLLASAARPGPAQPSAPGAPVPGADPCPGRHGQRASEMLADRSPPRRPP